MRINYYASPGDTYHLKLNRKKNYKYLKKSLLIFQLNIRMMREESCIKKILFPV